MLAKIAEQETAVQEVERFRTARDAKKDEESKKNVKTLIITTSMARDVDSVSFNSSYTAGVATFDRNHGGKLFHSRSLASQRFA